MKGKYKGLAGFYKYDTPSNIYIDKELVNNTNLDGKCNILGYTAFTALLTVYHEGRHAFQDDCKCNRRAVIEGKSEVGRLLKDVAKKRDGINDEMLELWELQRFVHFMGTDFYYYLQPIEDDAEILLQMKSTKLQVSWAIITLSN